MATVIIFVIANVIFTRVWRPVARNVEARGVDLRQPDTEELIEGNPEQLNEYNTRLSAAGRRQDGSTRGILSLNTCIVYLW